MADGIFAAEIAEFADAFDFLLISGRRPLEEEPDSLFLA
jgi:hypothetical protein